FIGWDVTLIDAVTAQNGEPPQRCVEHVEPALRIDGHSGRLGKRLTALGDAFDKLTFRQEDQDTLIARIRHINASIQAGSNAARLLQAALDQPNETRAA